MDVNLVFGVAIIVFSVGLNTFLTFYSRKSINLIADKKLTNIRQIMRELRNDRSSE
ncbi:hypothetical protein JW998_11525 [candidate division KSB1 bacterium]|nr:hypothetical protein [candidate division KSB1 bacterium]